MASLDSVPCMNETQFNNLAIPYDQLASVGVKCNGKYSDPDENLSTSIVPHSTMVVPLLFFYGKAAPHLT